MESARPAPLVVAEIGGFLTDARAVGSERTPSAAPGAEAAATRRHGGGRTGGAHGCG
jgi:hypothetical protein